MRVRSRQHGRCQPRRREDGRGHSRWEDDDRLRREHLRVARRCHDDRTRDRFRCALADRRSGDPQQRSGDRGRHNDRRTRNGQRWSLEYHRRSNAAPCGRDWAGSHGHRVRRHVRRRRGRTLTDRRRVHPTEAGIPRCRSDDDPWITRYRHPRSGGDGGRGDPLEPGVDGRGDTVTCGLPETLTPWPVTMIALAGLPLPRMAMGHHVLARVRAAGGATTIVGGAGVVAPATRTSMPAMTQVCGVGAVMPMS